MMIWRDKMKKESNDVLKNFQEMQEMISRFKGNSVKEFIPMSQWGKSDILENKNIRSTNINIPSYIKGV
ncbi:hypothetical protein MBAV_005009 [Candidatus Magnetobacterium bavaricum]|uniref:Uncharacterized protein n=1 Tax=Candidatus Magnetobacterium bavaricum TaxID=29290 RepID=A0A0F3GLV4_9BACT|nr:hypothetical protein MBAV_005009 [Candidatus Magnetobacterium bavaricum]